MRYLVVVGVMLVGVPAQAQSYTGWKRANYAVAVADLAVTEVALASGKAQELNPLLRGHWAKRWGISLAATVVMVEGNDWLAHRESPALRAVGKTNLMVLPFVRGGVVVWNLSVTF